MAEIWKDVVGYEVYIKYQTGVELNLYAVT